MRKYVTKTGPAKTRPAGPFAMAMFMFYMAYRCYAVVCVHSVMYIHNNYMQHHFHVFAGVHVQWSRDGCAHVSVL